VLFGNAKTNAMIARLGSALPLRLADSSEDTGLAVVAPGFAPGHLALVLSGVPFIPSDATARVTSYIVPRMKLTNSPDDYLLFRGSLDHIVAQGRFDASGKRLQNGKNPLGGAVTVTVQ
jgi:hypothetical protein